MVGAMLAACQKENIDIFVPDNRQGMDTSWLTNIDPSMPVSLLKSDLAMHPYNDSIEITNGITTILTSSGLQCSFPANCLTDSNYVPLRGKVEMQSILVQKRGDMIRLNKPTVSNDYVITSAGMLFVKLEKDEAAVKLALESKLNIQYRESQYNPSIKLFYGTDSGQNFTNWNANSYPLNNVTPFDDKYEINTVQLGWINAGNVMDSNSQTISVNIDLAKQFTNANTMAWLVFKNHRSVVLLKADIMNKKFSSAGIPIGQEATVIVISRQVDDYYLGSKDILISASNGNQLTVPVKPIKTSLDALSHYIDLL